MGLVCPDSFPFDVAVDSGLTSELSRIFNRVWRRNTKGNFLGLHHHFYDFSGVSHFACSHEEIR